MHSSKPLVSISFFFLGIAVCFLVIVIIIFVLLRFFKAELLLKMVQYNDSTQGGNYLSRDLHAITLFDFQTLRKATNGFNEKNKLGSGGFGPVYQGVVDDGRAIAVKQLSVGKSKQGELQFLAEVKMITNIQHKNLIRLIGCCSEGSQRLLVYEYMENKSLDTIIYETRDNETVLSWSTRFQIIIGIARGLQYLHEDSHSRIIHRDIKASNILLDGKFQPKIGDFGLAKFFPEDQAYLSTTVAGTLGYTAPEYAIRGELSEKADIYSYGVLVLEIISCRKNTDLALLSEQQYLPEYAWRLYKKSKLIDLVDEKLKTDGNFTETDVLHVCHIALLCLQPEPNLRPAMSEVVGMLVSKTAPTNTPEKPAFLNRRSSLINSGASSENIIASEHPPSPSLSISVLQNDPANAPPPSDNPEI